MADRPSGRLALERVPHYPPGPRPSRPVPAVLPPEWIPFRGATAG